MRSDRSKAVGPDPEGHSDRVLRPGNARGLPARDRLRAVTRRRWMALGLAGVGASWLRGARVDGAGERRAAGKARIYTTANLGARDEGGTETVSIVAIDPETGDTTTLLDGLHIRPRVSPDGRTVAFTRGTALWAWSLADGGEPERILDLGGSAAGSPPVWSPDSKQIVISLGTSDKDGPWVFKTVRVNADGTGRAELGIPAEDDVHDWSADGQWLLTASSRNAKIGWQLYVMRLDGTGMRQVTEGGNPFYARFSPDGRRLLYTDGTTEERHGIWVVGSDGQDRRRVFATGKAKVVASACWSPDGARIAVAVRQIDVNLPGARIEVMDLDGGNRRTLPLPEKSMAEMPDWR
jgi:Tol biopolymer transport system component